MNSKYRVLVASEHHIIHAEAICEEMAASAGKRKTGISRRDPEDIKDTMREGRAVIALDEDGNWAGFSYLQGWGKNQQEFVSNSGLIVSPTARGAGLAKRIKKKIFELSRTKYPGAKIFSITTGASVMKMNSELGFKPVTYSKLPQEDAFWEGCKSCPNYDTLRSKKRKMCFCTAMLYEPQRHVALYNDIHSVHKRRLRHTDTGISRMPRCKHMRVLNVSSTDTQAKMN